MIPVEDRIANLRSANARKSADAREAVSAALNTLRRGHRAISINAVAREAGVSRGFIYAQDDLLEAVRASGAQNRERLRRATQSPNEASLSARLATALDANAALRLQNQDLQRRIENLTAQLVSQSSAR